MTQVKLELEPTNEAPAISRSHIAGIRQDLEPRFDDVALVISELVSNSVRHSGNGLVTVFVTTSADKIRLEVSDSGPCFDGSRPRGDGLGLAIVDKLADSWGIDPTGMCTVWVELGFSSDGSGAD